MIELVAFILLAIEIKELKVYEKTIHAKPEDGYDLESRFQKKKIKPSPSLESFRSGLHCLKKDLLITQSSCHYCPHIVTFLGSDEDVEFDPSSNHKM